MKNLIFSLAFSCYMISISYSQPIGENCTNPKSVNLVCPTTVSYSGETTAGYANDLPTIGAFAAAGNDRVYEISVPAGSVNILVSLTSLSSPVYLAFRNNSCSSGSWNIYSASSVTHNKAFPVTGAGPYYLWIDSPTATNITYSISFGVTTSSTSSTKGNWDWDMSTSCTFPMTKPNLKVTWNGSHQNIPIVYSPTGSPGIVCGTLFFQNPTGVEGVKTITFDFGPHLASVSPTVMSMPGNYNSGTWDATTFGNFISWTFTDDAGLGYGDNPGTPGSCFQHQFCFNMTPLSNDPLGTTIDVWAFPDGRGAARKYGCCPTTTNCSIPGTDGASGPIGVAFDDPVLPVTIKDFKCEQFTQFNLLSWEAEINFDFEKFEIERSFNKDDFNSIGEIKQAASADKHKFLFKDLNLTGECYYRLKQTDKDGTYSYSKIIAAFEKKPEVTIYPQPASSILFIKSSKEIKGVTLIEVVGDKLHNANLEENKINISDLTPGIYFIQISFDDAVVIKKFIKE